jgi:hypothetical protein
MKTKVCPDAMFARTFADSVNDVPETALTVVPTGIEEAKTY